MNDVKGIDCRCCHRQFRTEADFLTGTSRFRICDQGFLWFECSCRSCLSLEPGQFDWFDPASRLSRKAAKVFEKIDATHNVPLIPTAVAKLQALIADQETSSTELEATLKSAPDLSLRVLALANDLRVGSGEITSLGHALSYIGRRSLNDILLTVSLQKMTFQTEDFSHDEFWRHAYLAANIAEKIALRCEDKDHKDQAFIAASLCNVGKIVAAICTPEVTDAVHRATNDVNTLANWVQAELRNQAFSHTTLGEIAAALWGLPDYVSRCVGHHHDLYELVGPPPNSQELLGDLADQSDAGKSQPIDLLPVVALANQMAHWISLEPHRIQEDILHSYRHQLGLSERELETFAFDIKDEVVAKTERHLAR